MNEHIQQTPYTIHHVMVSYYMHAHTVLDHILNWTKLQGAIIIISRLTACKLVAKLEHSNLKTIQS